MMKLTLSLVLVCASFVAGMPKAEQELEVCEKRPKYTYNILDALIVDSVEFLYRSSCNLTAQDPFGPVFDCFAQVLDVPSVQLEWEYRKNLPPVIGLKTFLCAYVAEASKCHQYQFKAALTCPNAYIKQINELGDTFVTKTHEMFCDGDGIPMLKMAAAHGDACLNHGRSKLINCMYQSLPTLQRLSTAHFNEQSSDRSYLEPACLALDVVRRCSVKVYSKCSTMIPSDLVSSLFGEFSSSINCPVTDAREILSFDGI